MVETGLTDLDCATRVPTPSTVNGSIRAERQEIVLPTNGIKAQTRGPNIDQKINCFERGPGIECVDEHDT